MENLRLNKIEQEEIRKKSIEINKKLITNEKEPMKESEILHFLLEEKIKKIKANEKGKLYIE